MFSIKKNFFISVVLVLLFSLQTPVGASDVSVTGSGWGDGIGLSQYGAKAMGSSGVSSEKILQRYYSGANVAPYSAIDNDIFLVSDPTPFWVGIMQNSELVSFTIESGSFQICFDGNGSCFTKGKVGETFRFGFESPDRCVFLRVLESGETLKLGSSGNCDASVHPITHDATVEIPFKARSYRHGILRFRQVPNSQKIHTIYEVSVSGYMKGLSEVPESWPDEAIKAQVIASRSQAVNRVLERGGEGTFNIERKQDCYCNLRDDKTDQIFRGWSGEISHPKWVTAVNLTAKQVLFSRGKVALALFSSSSGGATENYSDVFGGDDHPYLKTVADSPAFSDLANNPHKEWAAGYREKVIADIFDFSWVSNIQVIERNDSGSAKVILLEGIREGRPNQMEVSAVEMRSLLSLRSTTFDIQLDQLFEDVPSKHIFAGEVRGLHALGITSGCSTTHYCPEKNVTRAEMAAFLVRALDR